MAETETVALHRASWLFQRDLKVSRHQRYKVTFLDVEEASESSPLMFQTGTQRHGILEHW